MKIEVKKIDATRRELKFEIPKDRVSQKLDEVYNDIGKVAKIKGFRPGKAPRQMVEAEHGAVAREETIKKLIPEVYREGIEREKIVPLDLPEILDVSFKDGIISFTAKLDVRPEVRVKNYKGIPIKRKSSQVTDEDINKTLEFFKKGQGEKEIVLDDAFARGLGYPNMEEFKTFLRRQLEMDKDRQNRLDVENQIIEQLLKESSLVVPQSIVNKQLELRLNENIKHMRSHNLPEPEIKKKEDEMRKDLKPLAEKDVKIFLIMEEIAKAENFNIPENDNLTHKVMEFLLKEAHWE